MDIRVYNNVVGERPHRLRKSDLPIVAVAIIAIVRQQGVARSGVFKNVPYVRLSGQGFDLSVLGEDWEKILPFIQDGTFNPSLVPVAAVAGYLHPEEQNNVATLDVRDRLFYERVLYTLQGLFPDDYPTSNL